MDKAFDVILQLEVDATIISKTSYNLTGNRFRYQCLCCGEEVYLAAAGSNERSPHFRHRRGNNDKDCEQYLGQVGAVEHYVQSHFCQFLLIKPFLHLVKTIILL